jgi:hypothetical protein
MFTTEPRTGGQNNNMVWGERREAYHKEESKYPPRVMVWDAISEGGRNPSLSILHGTLDAHTSIFKF